MDPLGQICDHSFEMCLEILKDEEMIVNRDDSFDTLEQAKAYANEPYSQLKDEKLQKKLWMKIAIYLFKNIKGFDTAAVTLSSDDETSLN